MYALLQLNLRYHANHVGQAVHHVHVVVVQPRKQQPHLTRAALLAGTYVIACFACFAPHHLLALLPTVAAARPLAGSRRSRGAAPAPRWPLAGGAPSPILHPEASAAAPVNRLRRRVETAYVVTRDTPHAVAAPSQLQLLVLREPCLTLEIALRLRPPGDD